CDPPRPRQRTARQIEQGRAGAAGVLVGKREVCGVEKLARRRRIAGRVANRPAESREPGCDSVQSIGARVQPSPQLRVDPAERVAVRRAETYALERPARETDDEPRHEAGACEAPQNEHREESIQLETDLDLKLLLKRGALLAAANWPTIAIQFVAETTLQALLAVPVIGAAILVAVMLGADIGELLQGGLREIFTTIASTLLAEPVALVAFIASFLIV